MDGMKSAFTHPKTLPSYPPYPFFYFKAPPSSSALPLSKRLIIPRDSAPESLSLFKNLESYGFNTTQIATLVEKCPEIVHSRFNSKFKPRLEYLIEKGIKADEIPVAIRRSSSWLLTLNLNSIVRRNVELMISEGVAASRISKLLVLQPRVILQSHARMVYAIKTIKGIGLEPAESRVILQSHARMVYAIKTIKEIGLEPAESRFIHALRVICSVSNANWKKKVEAFMSLGWSKEEIFITLRKYPLCLACSERKLRFLMDFYVNIMKLDAQTIKSYPKLLLFSADKRIVARYKVLKVLESMKLIKEDKKIVWIMTLSEHDFLEQYITKNKDKIPGLLDLYQQAKKRKTSGDKSKTIDPVSARKPAGGKNEATNPKISKFDSSLLLPRHVLLMSDTEYVTGMHCQNPIGIIHCFNIVKVQNSN
ncbi:hypothetical protein GOBAR_AA23797 [Gossypium barbadense]|uniref:Uncharacterized protein n=1 Tax=Gossypium barbadense TaxID=3634 RepID=A0A2P5X0J8_GOSBA|nr:hypothetical protein GOBAR_AA23797 [Gossypium barbadense]